MTKRVLITGSGGLVGSACVRRFCEDGWTVRGMDCDARAEFFGRDASTADNAQTLAEKYDTFLNGTEDITDTQRVASVVAAFKPDAIIHAAAQPSHDLAAKIPLRDFDVNARATLGLLEAARRYCPEAPFVFLSTNKVFADNPNRYAPFIETDTRYEWALPNGEVDTVGYGANVKTDGGKHSLFGASKLAADTYVQEYAAYFGMRTFVLRAGCMTGGDHAGAHQHGFLSYLAKCIVKGLPYRIEGYKGKQVRDNIHAREVAWVIGRIIESNRKSGVYPIGGGYRASCSILEAIAAMEELVGRPFDYTVSDTPRSGDHQVYHTDNTALMRDFGWHPDGYLPTIYEELVRTWSER